MAASEQIEGQWIKWRLLSIHGGQEEIELDGIGFDYLLIEDCVYAAADQDGEKSGLKKVDTHHKSFDLVIELLPTPSA